MHVTVKKIDRGPKTKLIFSILDTGISSSGTITEPINVDDLAFVRFKFDHAEDQLTLKPSVTMKARSRHTPVEMKINCDELNLRMICIDDWAEYTSIGHKLFDVFVDDNRTTGAYILEVNITVQACNDFAANRVLYNLVDTTDFILRTDHGAVAVHKSILMPHSEIFQAIFTAHDSEESEASFSVEGVTVGTLQLLKDYVYLGVLPIEGLQELLLAAKICLMDKLVMECVMKLAETVSPVNLDSLVNFAMEHKIPELLRAILHHTPDGVVNGAHGLRKRR